MFFSLNQLTRMHCLSFWQNYYDERHGNTTLGCCLSSVRKILQSAGDALPRVQKGGIREAQWRIRHCRKSRYAAMISRNRKNFFVPILTVWWCCVLDGTMISLWWKQNSSTDGDGSWQISTSTVVSVGPEWLEMLQPLFDISNPQVLSKLDKKFTCTFEFGINHWPTFLTCLLYFGLIERYSWVMLKKE